MKTQKPISERRQVGKFGLIGIFNTLLDFGVYNLVLFISSLGVIPANLISTTVAMSFSFIANKTFVFGSNSRRIFAQALLFLLVTGFGLYVIQTGVIYILLHVWTQPLEFGYSVLKVTGIGDIFSRDFIFNNGAKAAGTIFSLTWNYVLYRNVVFAKQRHPFIEKMGDWFASNRELMILMGIMGIAVFFRFWQLETLPPGLHPDEAANGLESLGVLNGNLAPFYPANGGREGLFFYLQAVSIGLFGNTMLALRLVPALAGLGGVYMTYLAVKSWFSTRTALAAAFFMASAPWAVQMSRLGFRASLMMLIIPLMMWLFARAIQTNQARWMVATGVAFGAGFYTYISFRIVPLIVLILLGFAWFRHRNRLKQLLQPLLIIAFSAALTLLPLAIYFISPSGQGEFAGRSSSVSIFNPANNGGDLPGTAARVIVQTAGMFNFNGDGNFRHNLGGAPQLNGLVGVLFLLGILLAIRRYRDIRYLALLVIFSAMLIPELATAEGIPHALRAIGVIPVVYIFAAIGLVEMISRWRGVFPRNQVAYSAALAIIVLTAGLSTIYNFQRYFVAWANSPETYEAHNEQLYQTGQFLLNNSDLGTKYVVVDGYSELPIKYLTTGYREYQQVDPGAATGLVLNPGDLLIVPEYDLTAGLNFDQYRAEPHYSTARPFVNLFTVYRNE